MTTLLWQRIQVAA